MNHPWADFDYLERAEEFLGAYKNLQRQSLCDWARYLLIGHAVEVGLKAYLLPRGRTMEELGRRPFSHDLDALLADAMAKGLPTPPEVVRDIARLNHVHDNYLARYPEYEGLSTSDGQGRPGIVVVEGIEASVDALMQDIRRCLTPVVLTAPSAGNP